MFGQNPFTRPITFAENHNSSPSDQSQSQPDNSNTNTSTFLPLTENSFDCRPSTVAAPRQSSLFGGHFMAQASPQPFGQLVGGSLFGQAACNTPNSPFGRFETATEQQVSNSNISAFAGATPAPKMSHWEKVQAPVPYDKGDLLKPAQQQSSISSETVYQIQEEMKVLDERIRKLEEHQRSGFGGRG